MSVSLSLEEKISAIYERTGWNNLRAQLGGLVGITAQSRRDFTSRVLGKSIEDTGISNCVDDFWVELIQGGNRYVRIFELEDTDIKKVYGWLQSLETDTNAFSEVFPYPVPETSLEKISLDNHYMGSVDFESLGKVSDSQIAGIFCSKAYYTTSVELDTDYLSDDGKELLENGGEIIMKKRYVTQCFNLVYCDLETNQVWLAVDGSVLPRAESSQQFAALRRIVSDGGKVELNSAINLLPAVDELYARVDGRITSMGFITPDGNTSLIKLKRSQNCLRTDVYHKGGEGAAKILTKFKLGKAWEVQTDSEKPNSLSIELPGRRTMLDNVEDRLVEVHTFNCLNFQDLSFLVNKTLETL